MRARRQDRKKFLDASLVPMENALLARATAIAQGVVDTPDSPQGTNEMEIFKNGLVMIVRSVIAEEFQKLAEEIHHWL